MLQYKLKGLNKKLINQPQRLNILFKTENLHLLIYPCIVSAVSDYSNTNNVDKLILLKNGRIVPLDYFDYEEIN